MKLIIILFAILLVGCDGIHYPASAIEKHIPVLPDILKDCVFYKIDPGGSEASLTVVRCPNSTTSTTLISSKTKRTVVVIDGDEYIKKDKDVK